MEDERILLAAVMLQFSLLFFLPQHHKPHPFPKEERKRGKEGFFVYLCVRGVIHLSWWAHVSCFTSDESHALPAQRTASATPRLHCLAGRQF